MQSTYAIAQAKDQEIAKAGIAIKHATMWAETSLESGDEAGFAQAMILLDAAERALSAAWGVAMATERGRNPLHDKYRAMVPRKKSERTGAPDPQEGALGR